MKCLRQIWHEIKTATAIFPATFLFSLFFKRETSDILLCSNTCQNEYYRQPLEPRGFVPCVLMKNDHFQVMENHPLLWKLLSLTYSEFLNVAIIRSRTGITNIINTVFIIF